MGGSGEDRTASLRNHNTGRGVGGIGEVGGESGKGGSSKYLRK